MSRRALGGTGPRRALAALRLGGACLALLLGGRLAAAGVAPLVAAATVPTAPVQEYTVKAAYLLRFTRYVEWPAGTFATPTEPLVIGVLGANPFGAVLERTVAGQKSGGRPVVIRRIRDVDEAAGCHVVFIARGQPAEEGWLQALHSRPVLTVNESKQGLAKGAVLSLVLDETDRGQRVTFQASLIAAHEAGVRLSSSMLASASLVIRLPDSGGPGI